MATLDELYSEIPIDQIAAKLGVDTETADKAVKSVVPLLVGGFQANADDPQKAADLQSQVDDHAASGLLDGGVNVDDVNQGEGHAIVSTLFGNNSTDDVAAHLAGAGAGNSDLIKQLMPLLAPIVLAFVAKKLTGGGAAAPAGAAPAGGGGIGDVLGNILGSAVGGGAGGNNPLGSILGSVLGGGSSGDNPLGSILGNIFGGKK